MKVWITALLAISILGCTKAPDAGAPQDTSPAMSHQGGSPGLKTIIVVDLTPATTRPVDLESQADKALRAALTAEGRFTDALSDDPTACAVEVKLYYGLLVNGELRAEGDKGIARLVMEAEGHCPTGARSAGEVESYRVTIQRERPFSKGGEGDKMAGGATLKAMVTPLAEELALTLHGQLMVRHADDAAVIAALDSEEPAGVLMEAAAEAGERRLSEAVTKLVILTEHSDEVVALRSGAALGLIGQDEEGVIRALARMTEGPNPERHLIAVHAMGDIGGPRAMRYLDTLAIGHPEEGIREAARAAAKRARQADRNADTGSGSGHDAPPESP